MPGYRLLRDLYWLMRSGKTRSFVLLRRHTAGLLFQPYPTTHNGRYAKVFTAVRAILGDDPELRLLSFGCATGEELFTLRAHFPQAFIRGLDINPRNIRICRQRLQERNDPAMSVAAAAAADDEDAASYDAVFAMAVFRHGDLSDGPPPPRCDHLIRHADIRRCLRSLTRSLKPGGLLLLWHCQFHLADCLSADGFELVQEQNHPVPGPLYGSDNHLIGQSFCQGQLWRKSSA